MERTVLDTNIVIAGLLWNGHSRKLLEYALAGDFVLYSSPVLLEELSDALRYKKFTRRMEGMRTTPDILAQEYQKLVVIVHPSEIPRIVMNDPDDDHVLACALAARANLVVSGDDDLLRLQSIGDIPILSPASAVRLLEKK